MSKVSQRALALARRDALHPATRARASAAICAHLEDLPATRQARCIFCFVPFRSEVDTRPFLHAMLAEGRVVAVPRVEGPREMVAVRVTDLETDLVAGHWGIPEPRPGLPLVDPSQIDVVIFPGAAFDATGCRIGYGGGFYDTFIERLHPGVPRVGVAFEAQLLDLVSSESHDAHVHAVVTERRVLRCAACA
jgi:5-formyltetrahydrofolate cyclo-ligase